MSFHSDGRFDVEITEAYLTIPRFPLKSSDPQQNHRGEQIQILFDIVLKCDSPDGQGDTYALEVSNRDGIGTTSDKTRLELTLNTLSEIGFPVNDYNSLMSSIQTMPDGTPWLPGLIGLRGSATVEGKISQRNKTYYFIKYLNAPGFGTKKLTMEDLNFSLQNGGFRVQPQPAQPQVPQQQYQPQQPAQPQYQQQPAQPYQPQQPAQPQMPQNQAAPKNPFAR